MQKVAILITILEGDNRNSGCLEECQKQTDAIAAEGKYSFSIFLNDGGSEGCQAVWEKAAKEGFDLYLWMDYDLRLSENALSVFLENSVFLRHKAIITGTVAAPDKSLLFGGRSRHGRLIEPDPTIPIPCHLYDLSLTLIPRYIFEHIDNPSNVFRQSLLDYGCGAKVARAGIARVVAPGVLAWTPRKTEIPEWRNPEIPYRERIRSFIKSGNRGIMRVLHSVFR